MTTHNKYIAVVAITIILSLVLIASTQYRIKKNQEECNQKIDSLKQEIFSKDIELQRYEYVIDNLDSTTKENIDSMLSETE
jgi:cell division protein FtsL